MRQVEQRHFRGEFSFQMKRERVEFRGGARMSRQVIVSDSRV